MTLFMHLLTNSKDFGHVAGNIPSNRVRDEDKFLFHLRPAGFRLLSSQKLFEGVVYCLLGADDVDEAILLCRHAEHTGAIGQSTDFAFGELTIDSHRTN